jgi:Fur family ferric uptake transcriptional regulator
MKRLHSQEKEQFQKLFKEEQIDRFEIRLAILEAFLENEHHMTVTELRATLQQDGHDLPEMLVQDTLDLMCRFGFASKNRFDNGEMRYEHRHLGQHHDHMICTKCRRIIEFEDAQLEALQLKISASHGFHMLQHKMEIYGICKECLKQREPFIPLDRAKPGERLQIKELTGGNKAKMRLLSMGLRAGDEIVVITNQGQGQLVVAVDFSRYVLGRGLAEKIMVAPIKNPPQA